MDPDEQVVTSAAYRSDVPHSLRRSPAWSRSSRPIARAQSPARNMSSMAEPFRPS